MLDNRNTFTPPQAPSSVADTPYSGLDEDVRSEFSINSTTEVSTITGTSTTTGVSIASTIGDVDVPTSLSLAQQYEQMRNRIPCGDKTLEAAVYDMLASADRKLECLAPLDLWIVNKMTKLQLGDAERLVLEGYIPHLPQFPEHLNSYLQNYNAVSTRKECLDIAKSTSELFVSCDDEDKVWIDQLMYHSIVLLISGYLNLPLPEGSWDSAFHPPFWHNPLFHTPLYIRQKESKMGRKNTPVEAFRWDGIVYSKEAVGGHESLAFGLFEVSRSFGVDSPKWKNDWSKLVHGCRAMLSNLKDAVKHDPDTVAKLVVVGVLQSGVWTQVIFMSCVGGNLYYMQQSQPRRFPLALQRFSDVADYIQPIWQSKKIMLDCHGAVEKYFKFKDREEYEC